MKSLIWVSIIMTSIISGLFALGAFFINPDIAIGVFFISVALIQVIGEPLNRNLRAKALVSEADVFKEASKLAELNAHQSVALECEYCKEINLIPIKLNEENKFDCNGCNNENNVIISFATTRTSTPFVLEVAPEENVTDELESLEEVPDDEQSKSG